MKGTQEFKRRWSWPIPRCHTNIHLERMEENLS